MGLEPTTYGLQSRRSSQLSYAPVVNDPGDEALWLETSTSLLAKQDSRTVGPQPLAAA